MFIETLAVDLYSRRSCSVVMFEICLPNADSISEKGILGIQNLCLADVSLIALTLEVALEVTLVPHLVMALAGMVAALALALAGTMVGLMEECCFFFGAPKKEVNDFCPGGGGLLSFLVCTIIIIYIC